jgi:hypothetical protein
MCAVEALLALPNGCTTNLPAVSLTRYVDGCSQFMGTIVDPAADCLNLQLYEYVSSVKVSPCPRAAPALRGLVLPSRRCVPPMAPAC